MDKQYLSYPYIQWDTWINIRNVMLRGGSQTQKTILCDCHLHEVFRKGKSTDSRGMMADGLGLKTGLIQVDKTRHQLMVVPWNCTVM